MPKPNRRPANAFGGSQLPRISDEKLLEMCLLVPEADIEAIVSLMARLKEGGILQAPERDRWMAFADKHGLIPRRHTVRPHEYVAHDADRFSTVRTSGTSKAAAHLSKWARPGGVMPRVPGR